MVSVGQSVGYTGVLGNDTLGALTIAFTGRLKPPVMRVVGS
jgi:hypothetical protein